MRHRSLAARLALALALFPLLPAAAAGDTAVNGPPTILANDLVEGLVGVQFVDGADMAADGDWMAAGGESVDGTRHFLFLWQRQPSGTWLQRQAIEFAEPVASKDFYKRTIALEDDTLIVLTGDEARILERAGGVWSEVQALVPGDVGGTTFQDAYLFGDELVLVDHTTTQSVHLYAHDGVAWSYRETLNAGGKVRAAALGTDTLIVTLQTGSITFERTGSTWTATGPIVGLPAGVGKAYELTGIDGTRAYVADQGTNSNGGDLFLCERIAGTWTVVQQESGGLHYARDVDMVGDRLVVGGSTFVEVFDHDGQQWSQSVSGVNTSSPDRVVIAGSDIIVSRTFGGQLVWGGGGPWQFEQALDGQHYDLAGDFGLDVDADGDWMIVGVPGGEIAPTGTPLQPRGLALMYGFDGTDWVMEQVLTAPGGVPGDRFGTAVALSGDRAVVGAPLHASAPSLGAAYAFVRQGGTWVFEQEVAPFGPTGRRFGEAIDLDLQRLVIGAPGTGAPGTAFTYRFAQGQWQPRTALTAPQSATDDRFGWAVAVDRSHLAVSARAQSVCVYLDLPQDWVLEQEITPPPPFDSQASGWGWSLDIDETFLAIGSPYAAPAMLSGMVVTYDRQLDGTWVQEELLYKSGPQEHLGFGVDIEGDLLVASFESDFTGQGGNQSGFAIYQRQGTEWQRESLYSDAFVSFAEPGIRLFDSKVAIGEIGLPGEVRLFELDHQPSTFCWGDGSFGPCPCGNAGQPGSGCGNSATGGALLASSGTTGVALDDLTLTTTLMPAQKPGLVFAGTQTVGAVLGDGLLCVIPQVRGIPLFGDVNGTFDQPNVATLLGASAGQTWYAQTWYRDPQGPCGAGFNTSNGLVLTFTP